MIALPRLASLLVPSSRPRARSRLAPLLLSCALGCAALVAGALPARAQQTPAEQADQLNEQGKQLFAQKSFEAAYGKFRQAATLSPEGRFFFNMCYTLNFLERYQDAIQACEQVEPAGADADLIAKTKRALASLKEKLAAQQEAAGGGQGGGDQGTGGGDQGNGGGGTGGQQGTGGGQGTGGTAGGVQGGPPPPGPDPFVTGKAAPTDSYKWSLGGEIGFLAKGGLGHINDPGGDYDLYNPGGVDVRLFANFIVNEARQIGIQGSIGVANLTPTTDNTEDQSFLLADVGGALFLERHLAGNIYWAPLVGLNLSVQQPQELSQGFIAVGARAEVALSYVLGAHGEHAISVTPGLNIYFPAGGSVDGFTPADYGLDRTNATFSLGIGYSYRFSTPFGSTPLITLE